MGWRERIDELAEAALMRRETDGAAVSDIRCVLTDLGECAAKVSSACLCIKMPADVYRHRFDCAVNHGNIFSYPIAEWGEKSASNIHG